MLTDAIRPFIESGQCDSLLLMDLYYKMIERTQK